MVCRTHLYKVALISLSLLILIFGAYANSYAGSHYVDNAAIGANNGSSWNDAWESFADINWNKVSPGDIIYVSGGSDSKSYPDTLIIRKSGTSGKRIKITVGTDTGHNGKVIIDGSNKRAMAIYIGASDWIEVDGFTIRNQVYDGVSRASIYLNGSDNSIVRNMDIIHTQTWGIYVSKSSNTLIANNSTWTGYINQPYQTDGIYIQFGRDNIIDGNTCRIANDSNCKMCHHDPIQSWQETNLTVRNNFAELVDDRNNSACQGMIIQRTFGWVKVYNNVVLGSTYQKWQAMFIDQYNDSATGTVYAWNNTAIAQHPSGIACRFANTPASNIGEIKNNICITGDYYAIYIDKGVDDPSKVDYNIYENGNYPVGYSGGTKSWSQWRASGLDANGMNQNADLNSEFKPNASAPVVDAGTSINSFNYDKEGTSRPQGAGWDIGAFEYHNSFSSLVPNSPIGLRVIE
jgi:hypothetical protein